MKHRKILYGRQFARLWIPVLKKELDEKCARTTPMLLTSEVLYKILLNEDVAIKKAKDFTAV